MTCCSWSYVLTSCSSSKTISFAHCIPTCLHTAWSNFQFPPRTVQVHSTVGALGEGGGSGSVPFMGCKLRKSSALSFSGRLQDFFTRGLPWSVLFDLSIRRFKDAFGFVVCYFVLWQLWKWRSTHLVISWCCYGVDLHVRKHLDTGHPVPIVFSTQLPEAQMLEIDPVRLQVGLVDGYVGGQHPRKPVGLLKIPRNQWYNQDMNWYSIPCLLFIITYHYIIITISSLFGGALVVMFNFSNALKKSWVHKFRW